MMCMYRCSGWNLYGYLTSATLKTASTVPYVRSSTTSARSALQLIFVRLTIVKPEGTHGVQTQPYCCCLNPNPNLWPFNPETMSFLRYLRYPYTKFDYFGIIRFWVIVRLLVQKNANPKPLPWSWPLTFQPQNHVTSTIAQDHPCSTKFEHFGIIRFRVMLQILVWKCTYWPSDLDLWPFSPKPCHF